MANKSKHNIDIEKAIELLREGETLQAIARHFNEPYSVLYRFIFNEDNSARARDAMRESAAAIADKAEETLLNAEATKVELARARELAQHYRWKAGMRNPKEYGTKVQTELSSDGSIQFVPVAQWIENKPSTDNQ